MTEVTRRVPELDHWTLRALLCFLVVLPIAICMNCHVSMQHEAYLLISTSGDAGNLSSRLAQGTSIPEQSCKTKIGSQPVCQFLRPAHDMHQVKMMDGRS